MSVSLTGLVAAERRVEASSSNIANMRVAPDLDRAQAEAARQPSGFDGFEPVRVGQHTLAGNGVRAEFRNDPGFFVAGCNPASPTADAGGLVALSNGDLAVEIVNLALAKTAYSANLAALRAQDEMLGGLVDDTA